MTDRRRPRIGLALGAGGARGWAHIGVILALAAAGVKPDVVSGTSMGALVGAAYAAGELERLEGWAKSLGRKDVLSPMDFTLRGGLIRGVRLFDFFRARVADRDVTALPVPFGAVATELTTGREVCLREGSMFDAVRLPVWRRQAKPGTCGWCLFRKRRASSPGSSPSRNPSPSKRRASKPICSAAC